MRADQILEFLGSDDALVGDRLCDALAKPFVGDLIVGEQLMRLEQQALVQCVLIAGATAEQECEPGSGSSHAENGEFQCHVRPLGIRDDCQQAYYSDGMRVLDSVGADVTNVSTQETLSPVVVALTRSVGARASQLAHELGCTCLEVSAADWRELAGDRPVLLVDNDGLALAQGGANRLTPVRVDFSAPELLHRLRVAGARSEDLARAIGALRWQGLQVVDATAGWGRDSAVLAALGCEVTMIERHPIVCMLLDDGLRRAQASTDSWVRALATRLRLRTGDARELLGQWDAMVPDVVVLDPMFPERGASAAVRKEMRLFQGLLGMDADADELLVFALALARHRVVVKRPRRAPVLPGPRPSHSLAGRSTRFDVYAIRSFRKVGADA